MPSATSTKKRKQSQEGTAAVPKKKAKHDLVQDAPATEKKDKGKGKETAFQVVQSSLVVSISPVFASNPRTGVEEMLDSMIMRYIPALDGVVLSHSNLSFKEDTAVIQADCPFLVCKILFDTTVWRPAVGMKLVGKISLCSPDHISLLVHKTFNVSIPRHHIPTDEWEFQYGPAENDPEFGAGAEEKQDSEEGSGNWIHRVTASPLGEEEGYLEFTVIGLTVANEMLSLLGSIQRDPFSPLHVPSNGAQNSEEEHDIVDRILTNAANEDYNSDEDIGSDQDGFQGLHEKQDEAIADLSRQKQDEAEKAAAEKEEKKKKKKRKAEEATTEESQKTEKKKKKLGKSKS
ncbi:hypothetical protein BT96DRAFT_961159 [Gymnopus androsaceus JB14]|uniref:RPA43 OB domain-containing protein n=1 Tax=Gymnopus androsaceus JB14 TaxID=1447944 RepID=A0A6A4IR01_9AGAR|nr:hypothetical protein BT96DRAFT_961159 [Gymnopus androsaceus JB14]